MLIYYSKGFKNSSMSSTYKSNAVVLYDELLKWQESLSYTTILYYYIYV